MAFLQVEFYSQVLGMETAADVILPVGVKSRAYEDKIKHIPVLYLLHGFSEDHTCWMRRSSIERYVRSLNLAVIMPNVHRSFYIDMKAGGAYFTFLTKELPAVMKHMFPLSDKREDTFIAGLSMGGYGAFKAALSYPDRYAGAASLSGALDIYRVFEDKEHMTEARAVFGDAVDGCNDLYALAGQCGEIPPLLQCCGIEDFLYGDNVKFRDVIRQKAKDYTYEEGPGTHNWDFWDTYIQKVIPWMIQRNPTIQK
jgi:putative tributyrin esterase